MKDYKNSIVICLLVGMLLLGSAVLIKVLTGERIYFMMIGGFVSFGISYYLMYKDSKPLT